MGRGGWRVERGEGRGEDGTGEDGGGGKGGAAGDASSEGGAQPGIAVMSV